MMTNQVACPLCRGVSPLPDASAIGKSIRCGKCGAPFTLTLDDLRPGMPKPRKFQPAVQPPPPVDSARQLEKNRRPGPSASEENALARGLVIAGLALGMVLLFGTGIYLAVECLRSDRDVESIASGPEPDGTPSPLREGLRGPRFHIAEESAPRSRPLDVPPSAPEPRADRIRAKDTDAPKADAPAAPNDGQPADPAAAPKKGQPVDVPPGREAKPAAAPMDRQKRIDQAIDFGVKFLRAEQHKDGSWFSHSHLLGTTALPALTLLECGVPANDPNILKAAEGVRKLARKNVATYEISLAILFLDKLGDKKDKLIIQTLALRLLAGQSELGGWDYECPLLSDSQATTLLTALRKSQPRPIPPLLEKRDKGGLPTPAEKTDKAQPSTILDKSDKPAIPTPLDKKDNPLLLDPDGESDSFAVPQASLGSANGAAVVPAHQPPGKAGPGAQPPQGKNLKGLPKVLRFGRDDNSNTQFAMLALWAARRHEVPVAKAMALVDQRFRATQLYNGAWDYHFHGMGDGKASMTCVGLLGLAMGRGSAADLAPANAKAAALGAAKSAKNLVGLDGQMRKGLEGLAPHLQPQQPIERFLPSGVSLYFVWSVERVGVLYDLQHIGNYDWYQWGVDLLLPTQLGSGSWQTKSYPGSDATIDTCFALLFLKRVNLVQDLTDSLLQLQGIDETKTKIQK